MKVRKIKINDLYINPENPRDEPQDTEMDEVKMLFKKEKQLFNLMKSIAKFGFEPSERILVAESNNSGKYTVLDGNRRITCIKLLNDPDFLPSDIDNKDRIVKKISALQNDYEYKTIDSVEVVEYDLPAEEDILQWTLENKHNGENEGAGRVKWDAKAKQRFKKDEYKNYLVDFLDSILKVDRSFTTMERILGDPDFRTVLGIKIDKKEPKVTFVDNNGYRKMYYILSLIKKGIINVSDVYYKDDRVNFCKRFIEDNQEWRNVKLEKPTSFLGENEPAKKNKDEENVERVSDNNAGEEKADTNNSNGAVTPDLEGEGREPLLQDRYVPTNEKSEGHETYQRQPKPKNNVFLFAGIVYHGDHHGIATSLYELQNLKIDKFKLSATYLTRTLIECTLQEYLLKKNLFNHWGKPERDPSLTDLLNYCTQHKVFKSINSNYQRTINTAHAQKDHDELNSISHGKYNLPSEEKIWDIERRWNILVKHMIDELNKHVS